MQLCILLDFVNFLFFISWAKKSSLSHTPKPFFSLINYPPSPQPPTPYEDWKNLGFDNTSYKCKDPTFIAFFFFLSCWCYYSWFSHLGYVLFSVSFILRSVKIQSLLLFCSVQCICCCFYVDFSIWVCFIFC